MKNSFLQLDFTVWWKTNQSQKRSGPLRIRNKWKHRGIACCGVPPQTIVVFEMRKKQQKGEGTRWM